ncbi:MAG: hypothetical protein BGO07_00845 [Alphaproteobacteria bacterium 40-19]|nr:MAG: hypothetical protein BGO07_00845 [Alphaproteobacteria bacterium 40-19]
MSFSLHTIIKKYNSSILPISLFLKGYFFRNNLLLKIKKIHAQIPVNFDFDLEVFVYFDAIKTEILYKK